MSEAKPEKLQNSQGGAYAYPVMLNLQHKRCVIIGGGPVAARKLGSLAKAGAKVTVVAPRFSPELLEAAAHYECELCCEEYQPQHLEQAFIVIAATDSFAVNRSITQAAPALVNNATEPELSSFTVPSLLEQGDLRIAISTGGVPAYTRRLKEYLEQQITPDFALFADFLQDIRQQVKQIPSSSAERTAFWRQALTIATIKLLAEGNLARAKELVNDAVTSFRTQSQNRPR